MAFEINSNILNLYAINSGNYRSNFNILSIKTITKNVSPTAYNIEINAKSLNMFAINSNNYCNNFNALTISGVPKEIIKVGLNVDNINSSNINT